jgi:hypothetical protein
MPVITGNSLLTSKLASWIKAIASQNQWAMEYKCRQP